MQCRARPVLSMSESRAEVPAVSGGGRAGFTLVELLVVVAIIGALIAILLPTLSTARKHAQSVVCASNLRQLYLAQNFYADEHKGQMATVEFAGQDTSWWAKLGKYSTKGGAGVMREALGQCPSVPLEEVADDGFWAGRKLSYGANPYMMLPWWQGKRGEKMPSSEIVLMSDKVLTPEDYTLTEDGKYFVPDPLVPGGLGWEIGYVFHKGLDARRHRGKANAVMMDGSVRSLDAQAMKAGSGHWHWNNPELYPFALYGLCCY